MPQDFVIFPWQELTEEQRQQLQQGQKEKLWYKQGLSPFLDQAIVEPLNSLGLRYQGEVVGWLVTHRVAPDTIRYTSMFVEKRWQRLGHRKNPTPVLSCAKTAPPRELLSITRIFLNNSTTITGIEF